VWVHKFEGWRLWPLSVSCSCICLDRKRNTISSGRTPWNSTEVRTVNCNYATLALKMLGIWTSLASPYINDLENCIITQAGHTARSPVFSEPRVSYSIHTCRLKGKGFPQQAWTGPRVSRYVKAPDFLDVRHYEGGRSSALGTGRLYHRRNPWYSFLEAESTPGHIFPSVATEKSPVTPPGIDPETVRLVVQCHNHYATPVPFTRAGYWTISLTKSR
jgi:hypothetical protein